MALRRAQPVLTVRYRSRMRPMRDLAASGRVQVDGLYGVYEGTRRLRFDGIQVLPMADFLSALHGGEVY